MDEPSQPLDAIEQLRKAKLSPRARADLNAIEAELRADETETWMDRFQSRVWRVMKWVGIGAVGVAAIGGAAYVGKQAIDAFPTAVETAAKREVSERVVAVQFAFGELQQSAGALLLKLYDFMVALKDKAGTYQGLSTMATGVWAGLWADGTELLANGDTSPDQLIGKMKEIVANDPQLSVSMNAIFGAYEDLKNKKNSLEAAGQGAFTANDRDAIEFFQDYKSAFWREMRGKELVVTSAPASGSRE